jgi:hypothetical protein
MFFNLVTVRHLKKGEAKMTRKPRERVQLDSAMEFLKKTLADGPVASTEILEEADKLGLRRAIWRAKEEWKEGGKTKIKPFKGKGGAWYWRLRHVFA